MKIGKVQKKDSKRIWEIRNHPLVRKNSNNPKVISFENHKKWFEEKYFSGLNNHCFVLKDKEKVIGYCRFDFNQKDSAYITSIALDPEFQGRGWGHLLLSESLKKIKQNKDILAKVKKNNLSSIKLFQRNNFKLYKENKKNYYFKYEPT